jgi:hypothetical protein
VAAVIANETTAKCQIPPNKPGIVPVAITNDGVRWSDDQVTLDYYRTKLFKPGNVTLTRRLLQLIKRVQWPW